MTSKAAAAASGDVQDWKFAFYFRFADAVERISVCRSTRRASTAIVVVVISSRLCVCIKRRRRRAKSYSLKQTDTQTKWLFSLLLLLPPLELFSLFASIDGILLFLLFSLPFQKYEASFPLLQTLQINSTDKMRKRRYIFIYRHSRLRCQMERRSKQNISTLLFSY